MSHGTLIALSDNVFVQQVPANAAHYVYVWNENDICERYGPYISESLAETLWGFVDPDGDYQPPNHTVETELWELYNDADSTTDNDSDGPIRDGDPWAC